MWGLGGGGVAGEWAVLGGGFAGGGSVDLRISRKEEKAKACGQVRLGADVVEERSLRRDGWVVRAAVRERRLRSDAIRAG